MTVKQDLQSLLQQLKHQQDCTDTIISLLKEILAGNASKSQVGAFLFALGQLSPSAQLLAAVSTELSSHALPLPSCPLEIVDIVGTGGDGMNTFNVSTASGFIAAAAGCCVAKHGNRASSSQCGSGDVLEALGLDIAGITPDTVNFLLQEAHFCFLFAPNFHPALQHLAVPRKEIGIRTLFNILGPMINPSKPSRMLVGVYSKELGPLMIQALKLKGVTHAWVVNGANGLDEISPEGLTHVWSLMDNELKEFTISPADFGLSEHSIRDVIGGTPAHNAILMNKLLNNEIQGALLDFVLLNAAALLFVAGKVNELKQGVALARECISNGESKRVLERLIHESRKITGPGAVANQFDRLNNR